MNQLSVVFLNWVFRELRKDDAKLIPLRLFIGLGWIRAGVEKLFDPNWPSGTKLILFFQEQLVDGAIVFPLYKLFITELLIGNSRFLSGLIMFVEIGAGLAIFFGFLSKPALVLGILLNINFVLAGVVNPSAFYIIIQMVLLASNVDSIAQGGLLIERLRNTFSMLLHKLFDTNPMGKAKIFLLASAVSGILASLMLPYAGRVDLVESLDDPAMLLFILLGMNAILLLVLAAHALPETYEWGTMTTPEPEPEVYGWQTDDGTYSSPQSQSDSGQTGHTAHTVYTAHPSGAYGYHHGPASGNPSSYTASSQQSDEKKAGYHRAVSFGPRSYTTTTYTNATPPPPRSSSETGGSPPNPHLDMDYYYQFLQNANRT